MKKYQKYLMMLLVATLSMTFTSCGDDKDEPKQEESDVQIYGGTWICVPTAAQKEEYEYPHSISLDKNGSLTGKFYEGDGELVTFTGSWELNGVILNIMAIFRDDDEIDAEEWICRVISLTQSKLEINWEGDKYTFVR